MIPVGDVVLTYRSRILLRDGRVVKPCCDGFYGPTSTEITEGGGAWYIPVREGPHGERQPCEWVSLRDVVEIRIVGDWDEWPVVVAGRFSVERPATWPDYLPEGRAQ